MEIVILPILIIFVLVIISFISVLNTSSRTTRIDNRQHCMQQDIKAIRCQIDKISSPIKTQQQPIVEKIKTKETNVEEVLNKEIEEELLREIESKQIEEEQLREIESKQIKPQQVKKTKIETVQPKPIVIQEPKIFTPVDVPIIEKIDLKPVEQKVHTEPNKMNEPNKVEKVLNDIKEWIIVGDKYRASGVSKEYAMATNWLARIGIIIAVLGIGFGLRYSIQHGWVAPEIRVAITAIVGCAMIFTGLKLEGNKYELLGHGLLGGGITTLYFSVFSATHFHHLISPTTGMIVMALITATCGIISVKFNTKLVSILGIIGGYATPIMMSTGSGNLPILYTYMLLIGIGVLGVTSSKNWYLVQFLAFICHWSLFFGSLVKYYDTSQFQIAITFLTLFFLLFSYNACVYHLLKRVASTIIEVIMLILNATVFSIIGYIMVADYVTDNRLCAILTISLALLYIICSHIILSRRNKDKGLILTFIGLSAFFTTISLPILLDAGWLTISWSLQALLMLWLSRKLNSRFLQSLSYTLYGITFFSLINTMGNLYSPFKQQQYLTLVTSEYFKELFRHLLQIGIPTISFFMAKKIVSSDCKQSTLAIEDGNDITSGWVPKNGSISRIMQTLFIVFLLIISMVETNSFFQFFCPLLQTPAQTTVIIGFLTYLFVQAKKVRSDILTVLIIATTIILCGKVVFFDLINTWQLGGGFIYQQGFIKSQSFMRFLNFSMLFGALVYGFRLFRKQGQSQELINISGAISLIVPFIFLTLETNTYLQYFQPGFRSGGISILWSLYAIGMLTAGIRGQKKSLRYCGLGLFIIVIIKIFFHDLINLDELWRIIAFILLGCIIFLGSFIYIRFQHLFTTNTEKSK